MYRRFVTRPRRRRGLNKYNVENYQTALSFAVGTDGAALSATSLLIDANPSAGVRKVTNIRGSITASQQANVTVAVIYLPEGFPVSEVKLNKSAVGSGQTGASTYTNLYQPSQNVLWFGQMSIPNQINFKVPISKNLNGGDRIVVAVMPTHATKSSTLDTVLTVSYAICYR
nr:putative capsid protein [Banfec virus 2]